MGRSPILSDELLMRCHERAPDYDRENRFFQEDFDEIRETDYLRMAIPEKFGGLGMSLAEVGMETRRLAYHAPPTALALNMHNYWVGVALEVSKSGDSSVDWILEEAGKGEIFAAGHAETGNDLPSLLSTTRAEKVDGGYKFYGRKSFGSLTPVWTRLGIHGMDSSDPDHPKIIHAFIKREDEGYEIKETWDVLGMRATRSDDTILDGVFAPDAYIGRIVPAGRAGMDEFVFAIFVWALTGFANVYYGIARRAMDLTLESLEKKTSIGLSGSMARHPEVQHSIAEMYTELESIGAHLDRFQEEWSNGVDHGSEWPAKLIATKYHAVEGAWRIVDTAMDVSGGFGMFKKSELERLFRDARAGRFHPANSALAHEFISKTILGIDDTQPLRWG